ncbi:MAG: 23S rRNA (adenine(2503)-C(2))-methyltransferase RlmN [Alphaproteobacteria bacterium]|nr:23S rRNA (adenine(2503)-C(2))-methyltransferase RlmN [Alphaproteobacteria bacterium]MDX5368472.1 23S rRNA (adenine(2503)-C(2))-methyltransferase RlmN [Alphaproteobacteria bacterium]MDX5463269.1 23S rRNA (adenine(2503)-C(2))-methyltransferase RlmN [Alphaproteobacteria bacterium]
MPLLQRDAPTPSATDGAARASAIGMDRADMIALMASLGVPERQRKMRAAQLWHWVYQQGVTDVNAMTNMSKAFRAELAGAITLDRPQTVTRQVSVDGTRKYLFRLADGNLVETVFIPDDGRGTLCISSQVGCTLTCTFCHTGTQKLVRNLTAGEIVAQVMAARDDLGEWNLPIEERLITNIVLMGMGEPLYNFDAVKKAMLIAQDGDGIAISKRRITLSTSGVVPLIPACGAEIGVNLAISLHATTDEVRNLLVPLNKKYPIAQLLDACRAYPGLKNARRITFEYVMLKDVNDSDEDARRLVKLIEGIPAKINLIPFNPWPGSPYECSDWERIEAFADIVNRAGYASPVRTPRGRDIMAACGQLKSASERAPRARRSPVSETVNAG